MDLERRGALKGNRHSVFRPPETVRWRGISASRVNPDAPGWCGDLHLLNLHTGPGLSKRGSEETRQSNKAEQNSGIPYGMFFIKRRTAALFFVLLLVSAIGREDCWQEAARSGQSVRVLLCAVTFIDDKGRDLLVEMYQHGAELVAEGCMNKTIVEEIIRGRRR